MWLEAADAPETAKLVADTNLLEYVQTRLNKKWPPEQISHRPVKDFPDSAKCV